MPPIHTLVNMGGTLIIKKGHNSSNIFLNSSKFNQVIQSSSITSLPSLDICISCSLIDILITRYARQMA